LVSEKLRFSRTFDLPEFSIHPFWCSIDISGRGEKEGKGRVNMVQILYTHVCKWKIETIPGMWGGENKEEWWKGVNSSIMCSIYCKNFCKCHNVPPSSTTTKNKKKKK
jgi:hypothetical protein